MVGYILTILITIFLAYYDSVIIKAKGIKDHTSRAIFRLVLLSVVSYYTGAKLFLMLSLFYLIFDYALNLFMGWDIGYIGETAKTDKAFRYLGKILKINPKIIMFVSKLALIAITYYIYE